MNGIIHVCSHPDDSNPHFRITEEQIFSDVFHYLEVSLHETRDALDTGYGYVGGSYPISERILVALLYLKITILRIDSWTLESYFLTYIGFVSDDQTTKSIFHGNRRSSTQSQDESAAVKKVQVGKFGFDLSSGMLRFFIHVK